MTLPELHSVATAALDYVSPAVRSQLAHAIVETQPALSLALAFQRGEVHRDMTEVDVTAIAGGFDALMRVLKPLGMRLVIARDTN